MEQYPKRKQNRIEDFDYSLDGAYYITICTAGKEPLFWQVGAAISRPDDVPLSKIGKFVEQAILGIPIHYNFVFVDKYCIMPDHVHLLLRIDQDCDGRARCSALPVADEAEHKRVPESTIDAALRGKERVGHSKREVAAPTISRIVGNMKRWVSMQVGRSIWQKSFYDHCIRNDRDYKEVWEYIEQNPLKYLLGYRRT